MSYQHTARNGNIYYLHARTTARGATSYYFSLKPPPNPPDGAQARNAPESIPEGYEVYEHPLGQVTLRRPLPQVFPQGLLDEANRLLAASLGERRYLLDVRGNVATLFVGDPLLEETAGRYARTAGRSLAFAVELLEQHQRFRECARFVLVPSEPNAEGASGNSPWISLEWADTRGIETEWRWMDCSHDLSELVESLLARMWGRF